MKYDLFTKYAKYIYMYVYIYYVYVYTLGHTHKYVISFRFFERVSREFLDCAAHRSRSWLESLAVLQKRKRKKKNKKRKRKGKKKRIRRATFAYVSTESTNECSRVQRFLLFFFFFSSSIVIYLDEVPLVFFFFYFLFLFLCR